MNTVERFKAAFLGKPVDRVPVCAWLGLPLLQHMTGQSFLRLIEGFVSNPFEIIKIQEDLGLDPVFVTIDERWFSMHCWWRLLYSWPEEALETWKVKEEVVKKGKGFVEYRLTAITPEGRVSWGYQVGPGQVSPLERPLKQERDLDLLMKYMPQPESVNQDKRTALVQTVGDRAFFTHNVAGVWGEAVNMRGLTTLCMDLYERPNFVKRLSELLMERTIRRVKHLAKTGVHSIIYDQSWVGVGFSPAIYKEFMLPYDKQVVKAAKDAGLLVSFHNCGRGMLFLEEMVSTGAHSLETLTPKSSNGDFDLAEVKRRVGDQITLNGGFNERILATGTSQEVRDEVKRCLDAAASGGRYVLRTCGQVFDAAPGNIEAFAEAGRGLGRY